MIMTKIESLEKRVSELEEIVGAAVVVVNELVEKLYEPQFLNKIDKIAKLKENGKKETNR